MVTSDCLRVSKSALCAFGVALDEAQVAWPVVYTQIVQSDVSVDTYGTEGERETVS